MGEEKRKGLDSLHFTTEGKSLRWLHPEFHLYGLGMSVYWGHGVRLGFPTGTRTRDCRQVSLGKLSPNIKESCLSRLKCCGEVLLLKQNSTGERWSCAESHVAAAELAGSTHSVIVIVDIHSWPKNLFLESILAMSLWQSAGSYVLYSWFKLKCFSIMGQLSISSHPPPKVFMREHIFHDSVIVWTSGYCISLSWEKWNIQKQRMTYAHPQGLLNAASHIVSIMKNIRRKKNVWAFECFN